jgi:hypothetical protein
MLPACNTEAMNLHLVEEHFSERVCLVRKKRERDMPSERQPRPAKRDERDIDAVTLVAIMGAVMMLMAMFISHVDKEENESQKAAVKAYLDTGVNPPRI